MKDRTMKKESEKFEMNRLKQKRYRINKAFQKIVLEKVTEQINAKNLNKDRKREPLPQKTLFFQDEGTKILPK